MRRSATMDAYLREPEGACLVERSFAAFAAQGAFGLVVWGRPAINEARRIVLARGAELTAAPHALLLDYRLVEMIDIEAFGLMGTWLGEHRDALTRVTSRAALILPTEPYAGATVAGFYQVHPPPYPSQICRSLDEAAAWLGEPVVRVATQVHELSAAGRSTSSALASLLDRSPGLSLDEAATALGTSGRTLQRRQIGRASCRERV